MAADAKVRLSNKEVVLVSRPCGLPHDSDFAVVESEFAFTRPPSPGSLVLKVLWISIDPYLRELLHQESPIAGIPVYEIGKPLYMAQSLSKVVASGCPNFEEGDIAFGVTSVSQYVICDDASLKFRKVNSDIPHIPLTHYLGILGMPGHTAWLGINIITQLQPKEGIFISSASGAVGLLVGQLAKLKGCYVVGCAGSDKKVKLLKEIYNFDDAFNYKEEKDLELALKRRFSLCCAFYSRRLLRRQYLLDFSCIVSSVTPELGLSGFDVELGTVGRATVKQSVQILFTLIKSCCHSQDRRRPFEKPFWSRMLAGGGGGL